MPETRTIPDLETVSESKGSPWIRAVEEAIAGSGVSGTVPQPFSLEEVHQDAMRLLRRMGGLTASWRLAVIDPRELMRDHLDNSTERATAMMAAAGQSLYRFDDFVAVHQRITIGHVSHANAFAPRQDDTTMAARIQLAAGFLLAPHGFEETGERHLGIRIPIMAPTRAAVTWVNDHETGHLISHAMGLRKWAELSDLHREELRADGFAAAFSVLRFGDDNAVEHWSQRRDASLLVGQADMHWSSYILPQCAALGWRLRSAGLTADTVDPAWLMAEIDKIVEKDAMAPETASALARAADRLVFQNEESGTAVDERADAHLKAAMRGYVAYRQRAEAFAGERGERLREDWVRAMIAENPKDAALLRANRILVGFESRCYDLVDDVETAVLRQQSMPVQSLEARVAGLSRLVRDWALDEKARGSSGARPLIVAATAATSALEGAAARDAGPRMARLLRVQRVVEDLKAVSKTTPGAQSIAMCLAVAGRSLNELVHSEAAALKTNIPAAIAKPRRKSVFEAVEL